MIEVAGYGDDVAIVGPTTESIGDLLARINGDDRIREFLARRIDKGTLVVWKDYTKVIGILHRNSDDEIYFYPI